MIEIGRHKPFFILLVICLCYWVYLIFFSQIVIVFDAIGYEYLGRLIYQKGWTQYFIEGPNREPLYPFLISISMRLADHMAVNYHYVQKIFQVLVYLISLVLFYSIQTAIHINDKVKLATTFYLGISPAVINSAMSLFSEILAIPFVLMIIFLSINVWDAFTSEKIWKSFFYGVYLGVAFLMAVLVKGIFQYVFIIYLLPFVFLALRSFIRKDKMLFQRVGLFLITILCVFEGPVLLYKYENYRYNGKFVFTNRFDQIFFAATYHRTEPLTFRILAANIVSIPGRNFCQRFFSKEECMNCEWDGMDAKRLILEKKTAQITSGDITKKNIQLSVENILRNPVNYFLLSGIEFFKIMFWETTKLGFVQYPDGLTSLYSNNLLKDILRTAVSMLTILGTFYLLWRVGRDHARLLDDDNNGLETRFCLLMATLIFSFGGFYALCVILTRYALPIVPLYLLSIAFFFNRVFFPQTNNSFGQKRSV